MAKHFIIFFIFIIIISFIIYYYIQKNSNESQNQIKEGFIYNYLLEDANSQYPKGVDKNGLLVSSKYPFIDRKKITSKNNYPTYWWKFPNTKNSSYEQITNNLKNDRNPDIANSIPQEFNGIFYHNIKNKSNVICPNPPVPDIQGSVRVGYFNTPNNNLIL